MSGDTGVAILIVGAGPTGLGAAWRLSARGHSDWLLCEAADSAGGLAGSVVDEHGFTWDLGGHVQFSHYDYFDDLMDDLLGVDGWLYHDRESWVWLRNRFVPYPFQLNLHRLPEEDRARCVRSLISVASAAAVRERVPPRTFAEWVDSTFGEGIADLFLRPYNRKVWAYPLEELSAGWTGDRVALVDLPRVIENIRLNRDDVSWGPNNQVRFPRRGGTGAVWRALARRLIGHSPARMQFGRRLAAVDTAARCATFADGSRIRYDRLLTTVPLDTLVGMSDLAGSLTAVRGLRFSSTHVVGIGLHGAAPRELRRKCWMYFPEADCPFYRVTHFSHYSPNNVPDISRQWSLMAEVSESPMKIVDRARIVDETIDGLINTALIGGRSAVHHTWHRRLQHGYPTPSRDRDAALQQILPALESRGVYSRGRFGAWRYEVSNQDHSFAQGVECIDHLLDGSEETTLHRPEIVNARRSQPRMVRQ
jgi:protoporphyrinogen oxidase